MTVVHPGLFGRYQVAEPTTNLLCLHLHDGVTQLREVDHEPHVGVLDQEDLVKQGIFVDQIISGATRVDALGSCTANATVAALSNLYLNEGSFAQITKNLVGYDAQGASGFADVVGAERAAIGFYHYCTDQTGDPGREWPPTDCGSSGPYVVSALESLRLITSQRIAHGAQNIVSLLQRDGLLIGIPFLKAWMDPDTQGFVDGNGKASTIEQQIQLGVAGGHELYMSAIEKLIVFRTGVVDPFNTVVRVRNSWSKSWGDNGSCRFHLATFVALGQYCDFRQIIK